MDRSPCPILIRVTVDSPTEPTSHKAIVPLSPHSCPSSARSFAIVIEILFRRPRRRPSQHLLIFFVFFRPVAACIHNAHNDLPFDSAAQAIESILAAVALETAIAHATGLSGSGRILAVSRSATCCYRGHCSCRSCSCSLVQRVTCIGSAATRATAAPHAP